MPRLIEQYFPPAEGRHQFNDTDSGFVVDPAMRCKDGKRALDTLSTKWRVILSLEMQGMLKYQIAKHVGMTDAAISNITRDERYIAARDEYLETIDRDFLAMKPLAFKALRQGLNSGDEDTALKAADQWFRAAGFGGHSKNAAPSQNATAEDVVRQLLQINVQVNVGSDD